MSKRFAKKEEKMLVNSHTAGIIKIFTLRRRMVVSKRAPGSMFYVVLCSNL